MNPPQPIVRSLDPRDRRPNQVDTTPSPFSDRPRRLIIADDDELLRETLAARLAAQGYTVRCAEDGESAWQTVRAEPFDLLITDFEMGQLNGLELLRRMRAASLLQPAILMSGNVPTITHELQQWILLDAIFAKPFSLADLIPTVEALLQALPDRSIRQCGSTAAIPTSNR